MLVQSPDADLARERLRRASASLDLAELTGNPYAMSQALAEVGRALSNLGDENGAERHFEAAVRWARCSGSPDHLAELLCELADASSRVAISEDPLLPAAVRAAQEAGAEGEGAAAPQARARGNAARERARDHAFELSQLAGRISDPHCEARLLLRVGEVLERCGDHADALQMQLRALDRLGGVAPRDPSQLSGLGRLADL